MYKDGNHYYLVCFFTVWLQSQVDNSLVNDRQTVPFLPVNPEFSSTRNQGRQKLARFNAREFATLIIDILSDAKRRQQGISTPASSASTPSREKGKSQITSRWILDGLYYLVTSLQYAGNTTYYEQKVTASFIWNIIVI